MSSRVVQILEKKHVFGPEEIADAFVVVGRAIATLVLTPLNFLLRSHTSFRLVDRTGPDRERISKHQIDPESEPIHVAVHFHGRQIVVAFRIVKALDFGPTKQPNRFHYLVEVTNNALPGKWYELDCNTKSGTGRLKRRAGITNLLERMRSS